MKIPDPGTKVRVYYFKEKPGGVIGEEGEIIRVNADGITLRYVGNYEGAQPIQSVIQKNEISKVVPL
jgi:hypothetical protein